MSSDIDIRHYFCSNIVEPHPHRFELCRFTEAQIFCSKYTVGSLNPWFRICNLTKGGSKTQYFQWVVGNSWMQRAPVCTVLCYFTYGCGHLCILVSVGGPGTSTPWTVGKSWRVLNLIHRFRLHVAWGSHTVQGSTVRAFIAAGVRPSTVLCVYLTHFNWFSFPFSSKYF